MFTNLACRVSFEVIRDNPRVALYETSIRNDKIIKNIRRIKEAGEIRYSRLAENFSRRGRFFKYLISSCTRVMLLYPAYARFAKKDCIFIIPRLSEIAVEKKTSIFEQDVAFLRSSSPSFALAHLRSPSFLSLVPFRRRSSFLRRALRCHNTVFPASSKTP